MLRWLGEDDENYLKSLELTSAMEFRAARDSAALGTIQQALRLRERFSGRDSVEYATLACNLGVMYERRGRLPEARSLIEQSVETCRRKLGADHPDTQSRLLQLAAVLEALEDSDSARQILEKIVETNRKAGKLNAEITIQGRYMLMLVLQNTGEWEAAEKIGRELLPAVRHQYPAGHPLVAQVIAAVAYQEDDKEASARLTKEAYDLARATLGDDHPQTMRAQYDLAANQHESGDADAAANEIRAILQKRRQLSQTEPRQMSKLLARLGRLEAQQGHWHAAASAFDAQRQISKRFGDKILPGLTRSEQ